LSADRSPFKLEYFRESRDLFLPAMPSSSKYSFNYWMIVSFKDNVLEHFLFFVFLIISWNFTVFLFRIFLGLIEFCKLLLVFLSWVRNSSLIPEVSIISFFIRGFSFSYFLFKILFAWSILFLFHFFKFFNFCNLNWR